MFRLGAGSGIIDALREMRPDFVFNIAEGEGGRCREAHVPALLEMLGIPYLGSDPLTLCVTLDKAVAKRLVSSEGFPTPRFRTFRSEDEVAGLDLAYPVIVKPAYEGSSKGVRLASRAFSPADVRKMVSFVTREYFQDAIVEEFIPGPEVTVGLVGNGNPRVVGIMEIIPKLVPREEFVYSLEVKRDWENQVEYRCPPSSRRRPSPRSNGAPWESTGSSAAGTSPGSISGSTGTGSPSSSNATPFPGSPPGTATSRSWPGRWGSPTSNSSPKSSPTP